MTDAVARVGTEIERDLGRSCRIGRIEAQSAARKRLQYGRRQRAQPSSYVAITRSTAFSAPYTYDSLLARINGGTAYVNVHTRKNPGGEIRGQIQ
jgi:hypothetical protein